jgi:hypothetical protein
VRPLISASIASVDQVTAWVGSGISTRSPQLGTPLSAQRGAPASLGCRADGRAWSARRCFHGSTRIGRRRTARFVRRARGLPSTPIRTTGSGQTTCSAPSGCQGTNWAASGEPAHEPSAPWRVHELSHFAARSYFGLHLRHHAAMLGLAWRTRHVAEVAARVAGVALPPVGHARSIPPPEKVGTERFGMVEHDAWSPELDPFTFRRR